MSAPTPSRPPVPPAPLHYGGSFAPPLDSTKLAVYRQLAAKAEPKLAEVLVKLCDMVALFQKTPASSAPGTRHPSGRGVIVPLDPAEVKRIWDAVPWDYECDAYQRLFDEIPAENKPLRNAAFHLLWMAKELSMDREPLTNDRL